MQKSVNGNYAHLLLISPEVKKKIDDEFNQPLLHNCKPETGSEVKLSPSDYYSVNSVIASLTTINQNVRTVGVYYYNICYRLLSWVLAYPARPLSRRAAGSETPAPSR